MRHIKRHLQAIVIVGILLYAGLCFLAAVATTDPDQFGLYFGICFVGAAIGVGGVLFGAAVVMPDPAEEKDEKVDTQD